MHEMDSQAQAWLTEHVGMEISRFVAWPHGHRSSPETAVLVKTTDAYMLGDHEISIDDTHVPIVVATDSMRIESQEADGTMVSVTVLTFTDDDDPRGWLG